MVLIRRGSPEMEPLSQLIKSLLIAFSKTRRELATNILCIYGLKQNGSLV
jgi:hypothetical protein